MQLLTSIMRFCRCSYLLLLTSAAEPANTLSRDYDAAVARQGCREARHAMSKIHPARWSHDAMPASSIDDARETDRDKDTV